MRWRTPGLVCSGWVVGQWVRGLRPDSAHAQVLGFSASGQRVLLRWHPTANQAIDQWRDVAGLRRGRRPDHQLPERPTHPQPDSWRVPTGYLHSHQPEPDHPDTDQLQLPL